MARAGQTTYSGVIDAARKIQAEEGFRAFWKVSQRHKDVNLVGSGSTRIRKYYVKCRIAYPDPVKNGPDPHSTALGKSDFLKFVAFKIKFSNVTQWTFKKKCSLFSFALFSFSF